MTTPLRAILVGEWQKGEPSVRAQHTWVASDGAKIGPFIAISDDVFSALRICAKPRLGISMSGPPVDVLADGSHQDKREYVANLPS
jgi:hypothetical protein